MEAGQPPNLCFLGSHRYAFPYQLVTLGVTKHPPINQYQDRSSRTYIRLRRSRLRPADRNRRASYLTYSSPCIGCIRRLRIPLATSIILLCAVYPSIATGRKSVCNSIYGMQNPVSNGNDSAASEPFAGFYAFSIATIADAH